MRNKFYIIVLIVTTIMFTSTSCDKNFDEINTNKTDFTALEPAFLLNRAIINLLDQGQRVQLIQMTQWMTSPFGSSLAGVNYNQYTPAFQEFPWNDFYPNGAVPVTVDIISKVSGDASKSNLFNVARIWKAYAFMILTDTYGDVPYTEAGIGYLEGVTKPKYDSQEFIYMDILNELDEASTNLDVSKGPITGEILYGGNVAKWKRFGYSLLLRAAMRLSKIDPATAQKYVEKAVSGGLMQSNEDNAILKRTPEYPNPIGSEVSITEKGNYYATKAFVEHLKSTSDPRLGAWLHRFVGAASFVDQTTDRISKDPTIQKGMPLGYNDITIPQTYTDEGVTSMYDYSQFDYNLVFTTSSPQWYITFAQTQLLLAEAVVKGWASGNASSLYSSAISADMERMAQFGVKAAIPEAEIAGYVAANPLQVGKEIKQINDEYWVVSLPDGFEAWANFRRSGFPELVPNPYPASEIPGEFIRRYVYPTSEHITNAEHVDAAIANQGGSDKMNGRVWWDKQ